MCKMCQKIVIYIPREKSAVFSPTDVATNIEGKKKGFPGVQYIWFFRKSSPQSKKNKLAVNQKIKEYSINTDWTNETGN